MMSKSRADITYLIHLFIFGAFYSFYDFVDASKRGSGPRGGGNQEKDGEEMRPLNMMLTGAGGGGDMMGAKSGRRGIEACKEKLKEGLRAPIPSVKCCCDCCCCC